MTKLEKKQTGALPSYHAARMIRQLSVDDTTSVVAKIQNQSSLQVEQSKRKNKILACL